jgi:phosphonate transport system substrate-binding protein
MLQGKRKLMVVFTLALAISLMGYANTSKAEELKVLTFGLTPTEDAETMIRNAKATVEFLSEKLNMKVKPYVTTDYSGIIEAFRAKKLDVGRISPTTYVLSSKLANIEPFMVEIDAKEKSATYRAIFISRSDSDIYSIGDLKGKTFAFVDPSSTSGHVIPRVYFKRWGLDPTKDIKEVFYSGSHDSSCMAVKNKKVDAASVSEGRLYDIFRKGYAKPEEFRIFLWSDPIPMSPYVWRADLPADLKAKIREAFMAIPIETYKSYRKALGFVPADDAMYDVVREAAAIVGLKLGKKK